MFVVMYGTTKPAFELSGFTGLVHRVFHMRNPQRKCMIGSDGYSANQEFVEMSDLAGVVDLVDANFALLDGPVPCSIGTWTRRPDSN